MARYSFLLGLLSAAALFLTARAAPLWDVETKSSIVGPDSFKRALNVPYVFTAFTSASESNLYVYTSQDATNFSLLKGPAYTPPTGLIRDPSVILHTEYVSSPSTVANRVVTRLFTQRPVLHCM